VHEIDKRKAPFSIRPDKGANGANRGAPGGFFARSLDLVVICRAEKRGHRCFWDSAEERGRIDDDKAATCSQVVRSKSTTSIRAFCRYAASPRTTIVTCHRRNSRLESKPPIRPSTPVAIVVRRRNGQRPSGWKRRRLSQGFSTRTFAINMLSSSQPSII
jgi:hypothetical protein